MGASGCGIGLRTPHVAEIQATRPPIPWLEIHAENYLSGGPAGRALERLRRDYPISIHGVGLSLGSADGVDARHLDRLVGLVERLEPVLVSEHLSWSVHDGAYLNHLLPVPYTDEALTVLCRHVTHAQDRLRRRVLIENPAAYLRFRDSRIPEAEFLNELVRRTGCGLLCDVNNVFVSCVNLGGDAEAWIDDLDMTAVAEIHLAGHAINAADGETVLIDDHGSAVRDEVWNLYERTLARAGARPTLVEWDTDIPALDVLLGEAAKAQMRLVRTGDRGVAA